MVDSLDPDQRRRCMASNRSCDTSPETRLRHQLWRRGLRYRLKVPLPGKPDIVFTGSKVAVFVDGCFWHGCPKHKNLPRTNADFWKKKIDATRARDKRVTRQLQRDGWSVIRVWEHDLGRRLAVTVGRIEKHVRTRMAHSGKN
ncbi:very short patch repair endonuclease [Thioalkalivibrio sp. XN279]|uniref:very short patch repair endonuclease n=1 Tax=Thioalkalivibrio sp. XN279 TaxID=2714953 RepID=UPI001408048C|nr:very short patch repair endonuclease [Thioalkalivibrio sp. XN279]